MKILVLNCGSSSLKYQLINMENEEVLAWGLVEKIGEAKPYLKHQRKEKKDFKLEKNIANHNQAVELVLKILQDEKYGVISNMEEINVVGHRVVHGGEKFSGSVLITDEVINALKENIKLAPLHNPANIVGIEVSQQLMPETPDVGVFDTAFHQSMPAASYLYPLPYDWYENHGVRKYGFHGTSHKFVCRRGAELLKKSYDDLKIISCHLGNGASIAAVNKGTVVDTSMGLTPLEGLAMGTRVGDMDPGIIPYIMKEKKLDITEIDRILNKESGVLGISGISNDFRDLSEAAASGNKRAATAIDIFVNRVKKYIGSYIALMGGLDLLVFTAGIGENAVEIREEILNNMEYLGIEIDKKRNNNRAQEIKISNENSKVEVYVIPTNEELVIARESKKIVEEHIKKIIKKLIE